MPLPNEDTTPPVTKMYLVSVTIFIFICYRLSLKWIFLSSESIILSVQNYDKKKKYTSSGNLSYGGWNVLKIGWGEGCKVSQSWEKLVFCFFPLPKFGKCCRCRFYGFPRLGSVAGGILRVSRVWEGLPTPSGRFPKVGNTCWRCLSYFPILGRIFFSYSILSQSWAAILYFLFTVYRIRRAIFWPLHRWAFANRHED